MGGSMVNLYFTLSTQGDKALAAMLRDQLLDDDAASIKTAHVLQPVSLFLIAHHKELSQLSRVGSRE